MASFVKEDLTPYAVAGGTGLALAAVTRQFPGLLAKDNTRLLMTSLGVAALGTLGAYYTRNPVLGVVGLYGAGLAGQTIGNILMNKMVERAASQQSSAGRAAGGESASGGVPAVPGLGGGMGPLQRVPVATYPVGFAARPEDLEDAFESVGL